MQKIFLQLKIRRSDYQTLGGCQAGLLKSDKRRMTFWGIAVEEVLLATFISSPASEITNP